MHLRLIRLEATDHGIFGKLEGEGFSCVTLERHDISIPKGTYNLSFYQSPHNGLVPLLENVPNRSFIEIHSGNFEYQSKGCILVGHNRSFIEGTEGISESKNTLAQLVTLLQADPTISSIEIV